MSNIKTNLLIFIFNISIILFTCVCSAGAMDELVVYTPYNWVFLVPGDDITYSIDIVNNTDEIKNVSFSVEGLSEDWNYSITSGGKKIN
jgi:hypothetical protein